MLKTFIISILWLLIVNIFALVALNRFNLQTDTAYSWINEKEFPQFHGWDLISLHSRWDSFWYLDIAQNGYLYKGAEKLSNIVFFPIYPVLIAVVSIFTSGDGVLAGWIISSLSLIGACFFLYKIVKGYHQDVDPYQVIFFLLVFPTAFFLTAVYTESLFLFLSLATFYFALKKNFLLAGLIGFLAALTRPTGFLMFIPLVWEYYQAFGFKRFFNFKFLSLLLIPLGPLCFFLYHKILFGDWWLFFKVDSWWGRSFSFNTDHFNLITNPSITNFYLDLAFILFTLVVTVFIFKNLRFSYGFYVLAGLIMPLITGTFMSIGRYVLVLFPIYILIASLKSQLLKQLWMLISILLLGMYITLFVNNYWAG